LAANPYEALVDKNPYEAMSKGGGPLPANAGMANFLATAAGLPVDTIQNAINLGLAGFGTAATALGRSDLAPELLKGSFGGSESIRQGLRATGEPGLSPDNPSPYNDRATDQYNLASRGGFIPGGFLPAAGSMIAEKIGGPEWAGVGAMVPQAAATAYSNVRGPQLARQESLNAQKDATLEAARKEGYVVPPSATGQGGIPGFVNRRLESVAGKAAIGQEAALRNQEVTNRIGRREAGIPADRPVTETALAESRRVSAAPYREVQQLAANNPLSRPPFKNAADTLKELQSTRLEAKDTWNFYWRHPDPKVKAQAQALEQKASQLESHIEALASSTGKPGLMDAVRQARREMAKTYDVENATNVATGDVSAPVLGRMVDSGAPVSGGLRTAGMFQQGFRPYAKEAETIPTPGVSKSEALTAAALGVGGQAGGMGWWPMGLPLLSGPVRSMLLSRPYQAMLGPDYTPALTPSPDPLLLYQLGILQQQQQQ
jgi:protein-tyrosine-phosphatase